MWLLILLFAALLALTALAARAWARRALVRLTYERTLAADRCFVGEEIELKLAVTNDKWLPVGFLRADDQVPEGLLVVGRSLQYMRTDRSTWSQLWSINWYQRVTRRYRLKAVKRGFYHLGPVALGAGDPFGLNLRYCDDETLTPLVVYPRLRPLVYLGLPSAHPIGNRRTLDPLLADPMQIAGVRAYQAGDPLNRIHWKATATTGTLQVRRLEPTAQQVVGIFLNAWSFDKAWQGTDSAAMELGVDAAAALINRALDEGRQVALHANGRATGWGGRVRLPASHTPHTLTTCLEALARLSWEGTQTLAEILIEEASRLPYGAVVVVITRQLSADVSDLLQDLRRRGRQVRLILTAPPDAELPANLSAWRAREGEAWRGEDADAIVLEPLV